MAESASTVNPNVKAAPVDPRNSEEIRSLTIKTDNLSKSIDRWNTGYIGFGAIAVIVALGVLGIQWWIIAKGKQLSNAQNLLLAAKDRQLKIALDQKDRDIAVVEGKAGEADERAGKAIEHADALEESNLHLQRDVATLQTTASTQQERAAKAEQSLLELKERLRPRTLTAQQCVDFVDALKVFPNGVVKLGTTMTGGDEAFDLAKQLIPLIKEAGWTIKDETKGVINHLDGNFSGIGLQIRQEPSPPGVAGETTRTPELSAILSSFKSVGMDVHVFTTMNEEEGIPEIVVGSKPVPKI